MTECNHPRDQRRITTQQDTESITTTTLCLKCGNPIMRAMMHKWQDGWARDSWHEFMRGFTEPATPTVELTATVNLGATRNSWIAKIWRTIRGAKNA